MILPLSSNDPVSRIAATAAISLLLTGLAAAQTGPGVIVPFEKEEKASVDQPKMEPATPSPVPAPTPEGSPLPSEKITEPSMDPVAPVEGAPDPILDFFEDTPVPDDTALMPGTTPIVTDDLSLIPEAPETEPSDQTDDGFWDAISLDRPFNESLLVPENPDGFDSLSGSARALQVARMRKASGLGFSASGSLTYDSNVQRSAVQSGESKDDFIAMIAPAMIYSRQGTHWTAQATVQLSYNQYLKNSDFSGWGYVLGGNLGYDGGRWNAFLALGSTRTTGGNRYLGGYSEQQSYTVSSGLSYELSPKTRLDAGFDYSLSDQMGDIGQESQSVGLNAAALWRYSPLLEFGPAFRYRWESSGSAPDRITLGPHLRTRYRLGRKVALDSNLGVNFFDYAGGSENSTDPGLFAQLGLNYQMNSIWAFNFSLGNDSAADERGGYRDMFHFRAGLARPVRRANWNFGLGYESIDRNSEEASEVPKLDSFTADSSLSMPVFGNRANAAVSVLWRSQEEEGGDWTGTQINLSLGANF